MKRKVAQIGPSTLMVSLPSKWVKENSIKKGDEFEVSTKGGEISFSLQQKKEPEKEIAVDITDFSKCLLSRYLEMLYILNYNKIILTYSVQEIFSDKEQKNFNVRTLIKYLSNRFIGMEIVSQTKNSTELKCFVINEHDDLKKIEKRIFFLIKDMIDEFFESLKEKHKNFYQNIYVYHDNIVKFITYYLRTLEQADISKEEKKELHTLYQIIDKMVDKFRHLNDMINKYGCTDKVRDSLKKIFEIVCEQFEMLHKEKIPRELLTKRYNLLREIEKINYSLEELKVINEVKIFLDTINDFSRAVIVKEIINRDNKII